MQVDRVGASRQLAGVMRGKSVGFVSLAGLLCQSSAGGRASQGEHSQRPGSQDDDRRGGGGHRPHRRRREGARGRAGRQGQYPGLCKNQLAPPRHRAASRRWRGGRRDDSARRRREFFISAQRFSSSPAKRRIMSSPARWSRSRTTRASRSKRSRSWPRIAPGL